MKLQFLGDSRDSFKWDLLHHMVTQAEPSFDRLLFVPMLTADDPELPHGTTPAGRFSCRPKILNFVESLRTQPRGLERVARLGSINELPQFKVEIFQPSRELGFGWLRVQYWREFVSLPLADALIFLDPDNGFESAKTAGEQHVRFGEIELLLQSVPDSSAICVFQYRPQGQPWERVFARIETGLPAGAVVHSIHDGQLGFVFLSCGATGYRVESALAAYAAGHCSLRRRSWRAV